jgi:glutamyl-tRNA synthetase
MKYRTRFAPSPTGYLHVGGVRTALFDYLAAKSTGGDFYLRIEDTDRERFVPDAVDYIHEGLKWLGLKYDGEVVYQSNRLPIYQKFANGLVEKGLAYKCFCTKERLEELKSQQEKAKKPPVYDRKCCNLSNEEIERLENNGTPFVIRFKIGEKFKGLDYITFKDKIRGVVSVPINTLEDFIIIKSDGWPTYNFANVIDDHEMGISLVIRGDEFVPSTPKHLLLYAALSLKIDNVEFAHVPVIVGTDMKKLSKRNGDTALLEYRDKGYLPEAMLNFLVLLGWNPGTTEEIFSLPELEKIFSIERVGKAPAVFDTERLNWINGMWIRKLTVKELADRLTDFNPKLKEVDRGFLEKIVSVEQSRIKTLAEFEEISRFYSNLPKYQSNMLVFKKSSSEASKNGLKAFWEVISALTDEKWTDMSVDDFNGLLSDTVTKNNLQNADVYWPVRVALSGEDKSPSPAELLWVFGKKESLNRLNKGLKELS